MFASQSTKKALIPMMITLSYQWEYSQ